MGNKLLPLLVVLLCFTSYIYAAGTFSVNTQDFTTDGDQDLTYLVYTDNFQAGSNVKVQVVLDSPLISILGPSFYTFTANEQWPIPVVRSNPGVAGKVTFKFILDNTNAYDPIPDKVVFIRNDVFVSAPNLSPAGGPQQGTIKLTGSPASSLTVSLSSSPSGVTISPSSFTFLAGQDPYEFVYTVVSTEPGNYAIVSTTSGSDAVNDFVQPVANDTLFVSNRNVFSNPYTGSGTTQLKVDEVSKPIFVYVDVAPDVSITYNIYPTSEFVTASPSQLLFTHNTKSLSYTLTSSKAVFSTFIANLTGPDAAKYSVQSPPSVSVANRTVYTPDFGPVLLGVQSPTYSVYVTDAPNPPDSIVLSISSKNNINFTPNTLTFDSSNPVGKFTLLASNKSAAASRTIDYELSGTKAYAFSSPPSAGIDIEAITRSVSVSNTPSEVPYNQSVNLVLTLDNIPPTSFTVTLDGGPNVNIQPKVITFINSVGSLSQDVSLTFTALGSNRVTFTVGGTDAALVNQISSKAFTVIQYTAPTVNVVSATVFGTPVDVQVTFNEPVISSLDISFVTSPDTYTVTPSSFHLISPGLDAGSVTYKFTVATPVAGFFVLKTILSGPDAHLFPPVADKTIYVSTIAFDTSYVDISGISFTIGVPVSGFKVKLEDHATDVTLTPSSASLSFTPASLVFPAGVNEVCFSVTPTSIISEDAIVWTSSDPVNYVTPGSITFGPVGERFFELDSAFTNTITLPVNIPSRQFLVSVDYPPSGTVTLTPASTDGLIFEPKDLTFSSTVDSQYFTITATSLSNRNPLITWTVTGSDAANYEVPYIFSALAVEGRSLSVSGNFGDSLRVGDDSSPVVITTDYPTNGLLITPRAAGVTFSPASATLDSDHAFVAFTANFEDWISSQAIIVNYELSGPDAPFFAPIPASSFDPTKRSISHFDTITTLIVDKPGVTVTFTLDVAPETDVSLSLCFPGYINVQPPVLHFGPGQVSGAVVISAHAVLGNLPGSSARISIDVIGTDANKYYGDLDDINVQNIYTAGPIQISDFPNTLELGSTGVFSIYINSWVSPTPFKVIPVSQSGLLTFSPAEITFDSFNLHRFVSVTADGLFSYSGASETVIFTVVGATGVYSHPISASMNVQKKGIAVSIPRTNLYVNQISNGVVSLEHPPFSGPLTLVAKASPGFQVTPSTLVFDNTAGTTRAYFTVTSSYSGNYDLDWTVQGLDAAFYETPGTTELAFSQGEIIGSEDVVIAPGKQTIAEYTLPFPVTHDLTITPVVPASLSVKPAQLTLSAGQSVVRFSISFSNTFVHTADSTHVTYLLSGTDAGNYKFDDAILEVSVTTANSGSLDVVEAIVGTSNLAYYFLDTVTVNGLTITPTSDGADFEPEVLVFVPGSTFVSFRYTFKYVGNVDVSFIASGADAPLYSVESPITVTSQPRTLYFDNQLAELSLSTAIVNSLYVDIPPPTSFSVTPKSDGVTFNPSTIAFTSTIASQQFTATPNKCGPVSVFLEFSGPDAAWYDLDEHDFTTTMYEEVDCNNFDFDFPLYFEPNSIVRGRANIEAPATVSVTPSAPGCTFTPNQFSFTPAVLSVAFTVSCVAPTDVDDDYDLDIPTTYIPVSFAVEGADKDLFGPITETKFQLTAHVLTVDKTLTVASNQPVEISLSLSYPPPSPFTVTPKASNVVFSPTSFTFGSGTTGVIVATPTSPSESIIIQYELSGAGAQGIFLANSFTTLESTYGSIKGDFEDVADVKVGEELGPHSFTIDPIPVNDVAFTPTAPGCTFTPASLSFSKHSTVASTTVTCSSVGSPVVQYSVSGTDAVHYSIPDPDSLNVAARSIDFDFEDDSIQIFEENFGYIELNTPTENGLTITLISSALTFEPATISFPPHSSYASVKYTGAVIGKDVVSFEFGGNDKDLYEVTSTVDVTVGPRQVIAYVPSGTVITGLTTDTFSVVLDRAPDTGLVVRPFGAGATFTPETLEFAPGQTGVSFVAKFSVAGDFSVFFEVSGADADYYGTPAAVEVSVERNYVIFDIDNYVSPFVGVQSPPLVISTDYPPSDTILVSFVGTGFSPASVQFSPTVTSATFTFTPSYVGEFEFSAVVSGNAAGDFADTVVYSDVIYADKRIVRLPSDLPDLFAGVKSTSQSVGIDYPPPTELILTPTAPNVVFNPPQLSFSSSDFHKEYTLVCAQATQFNDAPDSVSAPSRVSWTLSGADAGWYTQPNYQTINVVPRDLTVHYLATQKLNIWFEISVVTSYPSASDLSFNFVGNFEFSVNPVVLPAGNTSLKVRARPLSSGSLTFRVLVSGDEASSYQTLNSYSVTASKWTFSTPQLQAAFTIGEWGSPFIVRPSDVPSETVTLTISSDYLEADVPTLTFGPNSTSASFSLRLRKGADYKRTQTYTVNYWVGGPAAWLFSTPGAGSFTWTLNSPTRDLTITNFPSSLVVGVPSGPITVLVPNHPFDSLTITPVPYSRHVRFSPPSIVLNQTTYSRVSIFTVVVDHPSVTGSVKFLLTGLDAVYYSTPVRSISTVSTRSVTFSTSSLVVGTPASFSASISYPIPNGLVVVLSSPHATFTPNTLTFGPDVSAIPFTVTGYTIGSVPVTITNSGADADWFTAGSQSTYSVSAREWSVPSGTLSVKPSQPLTVDYSVKTAPNSDLTITPFGSCVTFSPASATLTNGTSSVSFVAVSAVGSATCTIVTTVSGTDAAWYPAVGTYTVSVGFLAISVPTLNNALEIDLGDQKDLIISVDPPVNGVNVTFVAAGLTFSPSSCYVPPGHGVCHATFVATMFGSSVVSLVVSGTDAAMYQVTQPFSVVRVLRNYLFTTTTTINQLTLGATSNAFVVSSYGGSSKAQRVPLLPVNVSFLVSPQDAATVIPSSVELSETSVAQFQVTANSFISTVTVTPVISGPGAAYFINNPGVDPKPFTFLVAKRSFTITDPFNSLAFINQRQLFVGERSHKYGVSCSGLPSDEVILYLHAPGLEIIPSALRFTGTFETIYFTIKPLRAIATQITFSVGGPAARFYTVPAPTGQIRVTHQFTIPSLETVTVNRISDLHTVTISSPVTTPVYLTPSTNQCTSANYPNTNNFPNTITFFPPVLLFTPNSTTQTFSYIANCAPFNLGSNFNPVVTVDGTSTKYTNNPASVPVTWTVSEVGDATSYPLSFGLDAGVLGVAVVPIAFNVQFDTLFLGSASKVTITLPVAPRSDVILTLVGNNINFNPPHAVFAPGVTTQTLQVTFVHRDYKDSNTIPFTVDYIISGTNWRDYIPPAQTFLGVSRGDGNVVGGILGNSAGVVSVSLWAFVFMAIFVVLF